MLVCVFEGCGEMKDEAFMDTPQETALRSAAFWGHFLMGQAYHGTPRTPSCQTHHQWQHRRPYFRAYLVLVLIIKKGYVTTVLTQRTQGAPKR